MIDRCYIEITNTCNLDCHFCPKHHRARRQMTAEEFDLLTDKMRGKACFLYFHLMGEPTLHPLLPQFVDTARQKGFKTVLTSNGTLLHRCRELLAALPHKIQLSLHSHESNAKDDLEGYMDEVMDFSLNAAQAGTCMVLRLWNQGGLEKENERVMQLMAHHVPQPWKVRPDGYQLCTNLYLEFDRKFEWPDAETASAKKIASIKEQDGAPAKSKETKNRKMQLFCKALKKQIGILADGSVVPCCLDHNGDIVLGNLLNQSLEEILASPRACAMTEAFSHHTASEQLCLTCESALAGNSFRGKARTSTTRR